MTGVTGERGWYQKARIIDYQFRLILLSSLLFPAPLRIFTNYPVTVPSPNVTLNYLRASALNHIFRF